MQASDRTADDMGSRIERGGAEIGAVSREMVERRAREIAVIEGRSAGEVNQDDIRRASRELQDELLDLSTDDDNAGLRASRDPAAMAVDTGHEVKPRRPKDEQRMMEEETKEGVREAEHERMLKGHNQEQEGQT